MPTVPPPPAPCGSSIMPLSFPSLRPFLALPINQMGAARRCCCLCAVAETLSDELERATRAHIENE